MLPCVYSSAGTSKTRLHQASALSPKMGPRRMIRTHHHGGRSRPYDRLRHVVRPLAASPLSMHAGVE